MSLRLWPDTLPRVLLPGYKLTPVDQSIRTDMDVGAKRLRRISAADGDTVDVSWKFTDAEMTAFRAWFGDQPWSLAGDSDDVTGWTAVGCGVTPDTLVGPDAALADQIDEDLSTSAHRIQRSVTGVTDNQQVLFSATLKSVGRTSARVQIKGRDSTFRWCEIDLVSSTIIANSDVISSRIDDRGDGWLRLILIANVNAGGTTPAVRISLMDGLQATTYTGTGVAGIAVCELNARVVSGYDLFVRTDANGMALGAAGGSAWFLVPLAFGGGFKTVEARFLKMWDAAVLPGLGWHVSGQLEVRNA